MLVLSSMFALNIFVQWFGLEDKTGVFLGDVAHNILGVITIALVAPLLEEVLFRGAIQGYIMRRYNPWTGIVCAALIFGIIHMNPVQTVYAALIGVIFGWIYYRTGSLLSVVAGHVLNNSMAALTLFFFPESNALPVPEGVIPPEAQIVSEVMAFLFFAALSVYFAVKLHRAHPPVPSPWRDVTDAV
jgi:membrane protease YdiL (CAAX protease family)